MSPSDFERLNAAPPTDELVPLAVPGLGANVSGWTGEGEPPTGKLAGANLLAMSAHSAG